MEGGRRYSRPDPRNLGHYKKFQSVHGGNFTEESFRVIVSKKWKIPFKHRLKLQYARDTILCVDCDSPRIIYAAGELNPQDKVLIESILEVEISACGTRFNIPVDYFSQIITTDLRLTCAKSVEARYYKIPDISLP